LSLDRPFTYLLKEEGVAGTGSLVSVPFHGRTVKAWVLGPATELPTSRLLPVRRVRSPVRFFDQQMLALLRWVSDRYLAPLATVIERSHPPRVASEETTGGWAAVDAGTPARSPSARSRGAPAGYAPPSRAALPAPASLERTLALYGSERLFVPGAMTWLRPLPQEEVDVCIAAVGACLARGKQVLVLVPEAEPLPATAAAVLEEFGDDAGAFLGGDPHKRYRAWLDILAGRYEVVVGTRPAVFAPLSRLGLIWVSREVHPSHREDRAPYYHVREVAMARTRIEGAACVLASLAPSVETASALAAGSIRAARPSRSVERAASPLVETAVPQAEDRSTRLATLLKAAGSAVLLVSRRGYGVARVCRVCGAPAACPACRGPIVIERGNAICRVCGAPGRCSVCGASEFGVDRGGTERIAEWARKIAPVPVVLDSGARQPPSSGRVLVSTATAVKDLGPLRIDLVAILDPDRALGRAGVRAGEQALATWMEAAAWAGPRGKGGRVLLHTRHPGHHAIQALVQWEPLRFLAAEAARRMEAGFPPGHPVYRIDGSTGLDGALKEAGAETVLATGANGGTVCLVAVPPDGLPRFRHEVLRLAAEGAVRRVKAEPQL
jgi:primosomal protein N' (replication factor Y)